MMMLKPLLLPQLVEERRKQESMRDSTMDDDMELTSSAYMSQNSSATDIPSPVTPTFSMRGHLRYSSSASSMDVMFQAPAPETPSSPTFCAIKTGKRSLPDVEEDIEEEPQERKEDFEDGETMDRMDDIYDCFCDDYQCSHRDSLMTQSSVQLTTKSPFEYDYQDGFFSDGDIDTSPRIKKRRAGESPFASMASRIHTRFPSFSRTWALRRNFSRDSAMSDAVEDRKASVISSRSSSISNSIGQGSDTAHESHQPQSPSSPTRSLHEEHAPTPINIEKANSYNSTREEQLALTPLLPPLMMDASANKKLPVLSPLQSPTVADLPDPVSFVSSPVDGLGTPSLPAMPSPPLSTKPSISSFHRVNAGRAGHLMLSSEPPPFVLSADDDEWAKKLGHANFTVCPEPYLPPVFDLEACRQFRTHWDLARTNYTRHLVRTGEHYGVTSQTYKLTEQKWAETDALWKKNNSTTIQNTVNSSDDAFQTLKHTTMSDAGSSHVMTRIPSLNDPQSQGKFPQLGDEDIVGPMVQAAAHLQRTPSKKAKLMKFFVEKFPASLTRKL